MKDLIEGGLSYGDLLAMLRKDLQLDATTDLIGVLQGVFPHLSSNRNLNLAFGAFVPGTPPSISPASSGNWSVTRIAAGNYQVTLSPPFSDTGYGLAVQGTGSGTVSSFGSVAGSGFQTFTQSGGVLADTAGVRFIAIGAL